MKLINKFGQIILPVFFFVFTLSSAYGACLWDGNGIELTYVDSDIFGKSVGYEIEGGLSGLLEIESTDDFIFGDVEGMTKFDNSRYKSSYIVGNTVLIKETDRLNVTLRDGIYKVDLPNVPAGFSLDGTKGPCGEHLEVIENPLFQSDHAKRFTVGDGSEKISNSNLKLIEGQRKLDINPPHLDVVGTFQIRIEPVDGNLTNDESKGLDYDKEIATSSGVINISDLAPTTDSSIKDPVEYKLLIYFPCNSGWCTFRGGDQLTFKKTQVTPPKTDSELRNESNNAIEACRGDLSCVNCVVRKPGGGTFTSYKEAAEVAYGSGSFEYTNNIYTAIGCVDTSQEGVIVRLIQIGLGISGGVILIRIGVAVTLLQSGNPADIKEGQEIMTASIVALLIIVFAGLGVRFLGINVFGILSPGTIETT